MISLCLEQELTPEEKEKEKRRKMVRRVVPGAVVASLVGTHFAKRALKERERGAADRRFLHAIGKFKTQHPDAFKIPKPLSFNQGE